MMLENIIASLRVLYPEELSLKIFINSMSMEEWKKNPEKTLYDALRCSEDIDWKRYLDVNKDVAKLNMDPIRHFAKYGIHERRKLYNKFNNTKNNTISSDPKVSIIISNYNNSTYLEKCIKSVLRQTLADIEIIIVDDKSNDNSREILKNITADDNRVRLIFNDINKSQHLSRKIGTIAASGKYIMYLDSDDYISQDACEIAYKNINEGFDIVIFGFIMIRPDCTMTSGWGPNTAKAGEYSGQNLFENIFINRILPVSMWSRIYKANICKAAFSRMEDIYLPIAQDIYESSTIIDLASNVKKINDSLYYYRWSERISYEKHINKSLINYCRFWNLFPALYEANQISKNAKADSLFRYLLIENLYNYLKFRPYARVNEYMSSLVNNFGLEKLLRLLPTLDSHLLKDLSSALGSVKMTGKFSASYNIIPADGNCGTFISDIENNASKILLKILNNLAPKHKGIIYIFTTFSDQFTDISHKYMNLRFISLRKNDKNPIIDLIYYINKFNLNLIITTSIGHISLLSMYFINLSTNVPILYFVDELSNDVENDIIENLLNFNVITIDTKTYTRLKANKINISLFKNPEYILDNKIIQSQVQNDILVYINKLDCSKLNFLSRNLYQLLTVDENYKITLVVTLACKAVVKSQIKSFIDDNRLESLINVRNYDEIDYYMNFKNVILFEGLWENDILIRLFKIKKIPCTIIRHNYQSMCLQEIVTKNQSLLQKSYILDYEEPHENVIMNNKTQLLSKNLIEQLKNTLAWLSN